MTHKIILDTDPGIDDAMAILYAINHPEIELLGLTTVFGNLSVEGATKNALDLLDVFEAPNVPVAKGAGKSLEKMHAGYPDFVHGKNGLGNVTIKSSVRKAHEKSAAEFLVEQILKHPHEVTICAIAPLTNLAMALKLEPKIASLTKQVVIMGGAVRVNGNINPVAEANIYNDPLAADIVLTSNWPITLVGLDVTLKVILDEQFMLDIKNNGRNGALLYEISRFYDAFYRQTGNHDGLACHDATALAYITNPEYFTCKKGPVRVGTKDLSDGMTIFAEHMRYGNTINHWTNKPDINVCLDINSEKIRQLVKEYWY